MESEQIERILHKWLDNLETCSGKPHCCINECDLCVNCFFDLKEMFGLKRSLFIEKKDKLGDADEV